MNSLLTYKDCPNISLYHWILIIIRLFHCHLMFINNIVAMVTDSSTMSQESQENTWIPSLVTMEKNISLSWGKNIFFFLFFFNTSDFTTKCEFWINDYWELGTTTNNQNLFYYWSCCIVSKIYIKILDRPNILLINK